MSNVSTDLTAEQKRELLAKLLKQKAQQQIVESPLAYGQQALWFLYRMDRNSAAYNVMYAAHVRGDFDRGAFQRAFQKVVDRHAALRTTYGTKHGRPTQFVHPHHKLEIQSIDAANWDQDELDYRIGVEADKPFDLEKGPVIRVQLFERPGQRHVLLFTAHHIALDFWAFDLLFEELEARYRGQVTGTPANLRAPKIQFTDYVAWQEKMLAGKEGQRLAEYWKQQLDGDLPNLDLPTDRPRPPVQSFNGKSYHFKLADDVSKQLAELAKANGTTLYATVLAAFQVLLFRYSGQQDILVGSPTAGRNRAELEEILGYFLNPIVLRAKMAPEKTFAQLLAEVRSTLLDGLTNQDYPFPMVVEDLQPPRDASRSPIFQVAFGWDKPRRLMTDEAATTADDPGALGLEPFALGQQGSAFDLMLMMLSIGDSLSGALQYNTDLFDESTVARMIGHFQVLLAGVVANPNSPLADLPLLSEAEQREQLLECNRTRADYPREKCLHRLFEDQAARVPASVAVVHGDEQLTYAELSARANQLAAYLRKQNVGPDALVGICVDRSIEMLVGILGILKAGGAYVPLAPGTPSDRLAYMLDESRAPVVLTQSELLDELPQHSGKTICLDKDWPSIAQEPRANLAPASEPHNLAYVIFTSGSTGKPKGVQIEHRTVVNFLNSMRREPGITPEDNLLAVTTLTFDISVLELFLPISVGARVTIVTREQAADGVQLLKALGDTEATIMQATPATWRILIEAGWQGDGKLKVLCGGEAMPRDLADQLLERAGSLWNMYGPTETTIWSAVDHVGPGVGGVPIGHPIDNTQIYILDSRMQPVPIGVPGDLYIAGDGLARGYLNRPDLTAERFILDPFAASTSRLPSGTLDGGNHSDISTPSLDVQRTTATTSLPAEGTYLARMYQTGDLARRRADGNIDFLGRQDFQVKVRGFRIELGEIEATLNEHPAIQQSVVTARQMGQHMDDKALVAYFIADGDEPPNVSELREFLKGELPDYMIPAIFMALDRFPLNPAGKVDRKALPEPDTARPELINEYVAPRDEAEETFAEIWADVLAVDQVGIHDNYFDLGGASMQGLEIAALAADEGYEMTPAMLFQYPTIAELAAAVARSVPTDLAPPSGNGDSGHLVAALPTTEPAKTKPVPLPKPVTEKKTEKINTIIESVGIYLPPNVVSTKELLKRCHKKMWFPLEKMTGIKNRRMCSPDELSKDIAIKAVDECLANSKYEADDMDMLISCNITRSDEYRKMSVEPNTAIQVKAHFGFKNAICFDVCNACTGMFTAIKIVESFINAGAIRRAMVISGEYVTGISETALIEIAEFMDPRLACLTVGDAGAAVIVEGAANNDVGFHELDMYSLSKYCWMCVGRLTEHPHGGAIMHVPDPMEHTMVAVKNSVANALYNFERSPWSPEDMDVLIMHQTSDRSLRDGMRAINKALGKKKICTKENTINNLAERGNTATTTHFVALWDSIYNGQIKSGDNAVFGITGSGQTIGTGIYTFDDLPDRMRRYRETGQRPKKLLAGVTEPPLPAPAGPRVHLHSIGTLPLDEVPERDTTRMTTQAAEACLAKSTYDRSDIELLIFGGMLRTGYISEPAIATLIGGELKMNDIIESEHDKKTFCFDIYNASLGLLHALEIATRMIQAGEYQTAMVCASEVEVNADFFPGDTLGFCETASAAILETAPDGVSGFGQFVFKYHHEHADARKAIGGYLDGKPHLNLLVDPEIDGLYLKYIPAAVEELLDREGLDLSQIAVLMPPQFSTQFNLNLAQALGIAADKVVDLPHDRGDLFTSSPLYGIEAAQNRGLAKPGDVGLIINVGSGIQIGCATYYF